MSIKGRGHPSKVIIYNGPIGNQQVNSSDIGTFNDLGAEGVFVEVSRPGDTGTLVDDDLDIQTPKSDDDTGTAVESIADRELSDGDTGSGNEDPIGAEFGTFTEAEPSLGNDIQNADTGTGVDVHTQLEITTDADTGTSADTHTNRSFTAKDQSGTTVEFGVVGSASPSSSDTGHFEETENSIDRGAPPFRTLKVDAEDRTKVVPVENRTYVVPAEVRVRVVS